MATLNGLSNLFEFLKPTERLSLYLEAASRGDWTEVERLKSTCPKVTYVGTDAAFTDRGEMSFDKTSCVAIDLYRSIGEINLLHYLAQQMPALASVHAMNASLAFLEGMGCAAGRPPQLVYARVMAGIEGAGTAATEPQSAEATEEPGDEPEDDAADETDDETDDEDEGEELTPDALRRLDAIEKVARDDTEWIATYMLRCAAKSAQNLVNTWEAYRRFCRKCVGAEPMTVLRAWGVPFADHLAEILAAYAVLKPEEPVVTELEGYISEAWLERFEPAEGVGA